MPQEALNENLEGGDSQEGEEVTESMLLVDQEPTNLQERYTRGLIPLRVIQRMAIGGFLGATYQLHKLVETI